MPAGLATTRSTRTWPETQTGKTQGLVLLEETRGQSGVGGEEDEEGWCYLLGGGVVCVYCGSCG